MFTVALMQSDATRTLMYQTRSLSGGRDAGDGPLSKSRGRDKRGDVLFSQFSPPSASAHCTSS